MPGRPDPARAHGAAPEAAELAVTWFGHASALLEVDGARVLVDPVWSHRVSPSPVFGPTRLHEPPMPLEELPPVDVVLISHDHYDHLDLPTVRALLETQTRAVRRPDRHRRAPAQVARARTTGSSSWTGTRARPSPA